MVNQTGDTPAWLIPSRVYDVLKWVGLIVCPALAVLFGTVAAFWCYLSGLKWISPVVAGLLNCLEPLSAFFFSIVLLGDRIGAVQAIGIALVVSNVALLALAKGRR